MGEEKKYRALEPTSWDCHDMSISWAAFTSIEQWKRLRNRLPASNAVQFRKGSSKIIVRATTESGGVVFQVDPF